MISGTKSPGERMVLWKVTRSTRPDRGSRSVEAMWGTMRPAMSWLPCKCRGADRKRRPHYVHGRLRTVRVTRRTDIFQPLAEEQLVGEEALVRVEDRLPRHEDVVRAFGGSLRFLGSGLGHGLLGSVSVLGVSCSYLPHTFLNLEPEGLPR